MTEPTAKPIAAAGDLADRFRAAATAAQAHDWVGTAYVLRDLASQLDAPDLEADDLAADIWHALLTGRQR